MKIKKYSISHQLIEKITSMIEEGKYKPGDKLPTIKQLSSDFGVSTAAVREAIRSMEIAGMLVLKHGRGVYIADESTLFSSSLLNFSSVLQTKLKALYETRMILEVGYIPLVVERITKDDIEQLWRLVDKLDLQNQTDWEEHSIDFHCTIAKSTGNMFIYGIMKILFQVLKNDIGFTSRSGVLNNFKTQEDVLKVGHEKIIKAIESRDVDVISNIMISHIKTGMKMHESALKDLL